MVASHWLRISAFHILPDKHMAQSVDDLGSVLSWLSQLCTFLSTLAMSRSLLLACYPVDIHLVIQPHLDHYRNESLWISANFCWKLGDISHLISTMTLAGSIRSSHFSLRWMAGSEDHCCRSRRTSLLRRSTCSHFWETWKRTMPIIIHKSSYRSIVFLKKIIFFYSMITNGLRINASKL